MEESTRNNEGLLCYGFYITHISDYCIPLLSGLPMALPTAHGQNRSYRSRGTKKSI